MCVCVQVGPREGGSVQAERGSHLLSVQQSAALDLTCNVDSITTCRHGEGEGRRVYQAGDGRVKGCKGLVKEVLGGKEGVGCEGKVMGQDGRW